MWSIISNYPTGKVDWFVAGVYLLPNSVGLVNDQKSGVEFSIFPASEKQEPAALNNNQQENLDKIHADNVIKQRGGGHINRKKYKNRFFPKKGHLKNLKTFHGPNLDLDLSRHINRNYILLPSPFKMQRFYECIL